MKTLTARLSYTSSSGSPQAARFNAPTTFPIKVLDAEGAVLAEGAATLHEPAEFTLEDSLELAFVRLTWPSGKLDTRRVQLKGIGHAEVDFNDSSIARNEWSAWAVPRLNSRTPLTQSSGEVDLDLERFDRVWLRMWRFAEGAWQHTPVRPDSQYRNGAAWQLDFTLDQHPWLLQVGGSKVVWRLVALAGGGPARVLITPRDSDDPRADPLKVIATSFRADAETLLEFLARDSMRAADAMTKGTSMARKLFAEKYDDPMSAVVGAYYLLRVDRWQSTPLWWFDNLVQDFPWIPDTSIVRCIRQLREGLSGKPEVSQARAFFRQAIERGWPVYSEGILLLQEAASLLRKGSPRTDWPLFELVEDLGSAKAWAGAATSFYGRTPASPSAVQWVGMPKTPRRRRLLDPALTGEDDRGDPTALSFALTESVRGQKLKVRSVQRVELKQAADAQEFLLGDIAR